MTSYDVTCFHVKNCQTINQIICQMIDFYHCAGFLVIPLYIFMKAEIYLRIPTLVSIIICKARRVFFPRKFCKSVVFEFHYLHSVWFLVVYKSYHTLRWRKQFLRTHHKVNMGRQKQLNSMSIESSYHCILCVQNDFAYCQYIFFWKNK